MSGVNRNLQADIMEKGLTGEAAMNAMSQESLRNEKGTTTEDFTEGTNRHAGK